MLVIDASVAVQASLVDAGFEDVADPELCAPPLMWSETRSALHAAAWRGELDPAAAGAAAARLEAAPVRWTVPDGLGEEAWTIADQLGWAKTYDAEYVATASLLGCRLVTADRRLLRASQALGIVVGLDQLGA